jgi:hypothetical protein
VAVLQNDARADVIVVGLAVVIVVDAVDARARRATQPAPHRQGQPAAASNSREIARFPFRLEGEVLGGALG